MRRTAKALPTDSTATHAGALDIGLATAPGAPPGTALLSARCTHYPGHQQLTVWLPPSARMGQPDYGDLRVLRSDGLVVERAAVAGRLQGPVQLLFDTLAWPAGAYRLEIVHRQGWQHVLPLFKHGPPPPAPPPAEAPVTFRNGRGGLSLETDFLARSACCRLEYEGNFRAGTITYVEGGTRIALWHEMGGGQCRFFIHLPSAAQWERATGTPLARRDGIVDFVAEAVRRKEAGSWRYVIEDTQIAYY